MIPTKGEIGIWHKSPSCVDVTWDLEISSDLKEASCPLFEFAGFRCYIAVDISRPGHIRCEVWCCRSNHPNPEIKARIILLTEDGVEFEIPTEVIEYEMTNYGTVASADTTLPWDVAQSVVPGDTLTVTAKLENIETTQEVAGSSNSKNSSVANQRPQHLQITPLLQGSLDIMWSIPDFLALPYNRAAGVLSKDFQIPEGTMFFVMFPYGTPTKPDYIHVYANFTCKANQGIRTPEMDCDMAVKTAEGTLCRGLKDEDKELLGNYFGCFYRHFSRSEVIQRSHSLLPGGDLTLWIRLSRRRRIVNSSDESDEDFQGHSD